MDSVKSEVTRQKFSDFAPCFTRKSPNSVSPIRKPRISTTPHSPSYGFSTEISVRIVRNTLKFVYRKSMLRRCKVAFWRCTDEAVVMHVVGMVVVVVPLMVVVVVEVANVAPDKFPRSCRTPTPLPSRRCGANRVHAVVSVNPRNRRAERCHKTHKPTENWPKPFSLAKQRIKFCYSKYLYVGCPSLTKASKRIPNTTTANYWTQEKTYRSVIIPDAKLHFLYILETHFVAPTVRFLQLSLITYNPIITITLYKVLHYKFT